MLYSAVVRTLGRLEKWYDVPVSNREKTLVETVQVPADHDSDEGHDALIRAALDFHPDLSIKWALLGLI
jgi:hypothetical protein